MKRMKMIIFHFNFVFEFDNSRHITTTTLSISSGLQDVVERYKALRTEKVLELSH
jgi:hypothetical protein